MMMIGGNFRRKDAFEGGKFEERAGEFGRELDPGWKKEERSRVCSCDGEERRRKREGGRTMVRLGGREGRSKHLDVG